MRVRNTQPHAGAFIWRLLAQCGRAKHVASGGQATGLTGKRSDEAISRLP